MGETNLHIKPVVLIKSENVSYTIKRSVCVYLSVSLTA